MTTYAGIDLQSIANSLWWVLSIGVSVGAAIKYWPRRRRWTSRKSLEQPLHNIYQQDAYMVVTVAPVGTGDRPDRAITSVMHGVWWTPVFELDERGWALSYVLERSSPEQAEAQWRAHNGLS